MADSRMIRTTIELSGEGSYKNKLKEIQTGLKSLASAQKVVSAQYDKDDKSLAALTARQGLYQDKLTLQKQKLEAVRQEYERVVTAEGENSDSARKLANEYNYVSAQVIQTEKQIKTIGEEMEHAALAAEEAGGAAGDAADDVKKLGANSSTAATNMKKIEAAAENQQAALKKVGEQAEKTAGKLSKMLGAATAAAVTVSVKGFMDFEDAMAPVATLADTTAVSMEKLSEQALAASDATGLAATEVAQGAYTALSSGVDTANVMNYMTEAAKAAKAGQSDLNTVVDGSTSIMNAWKISSSEATGVFEKMLVAQDKGKTTLGQLSQSIGQITGLAPQLNLSLEETLASVAALTKSGVQTSTAINGLKAVMSNVLKPTADAAKAAKEMGLEFNAAALQSKGLTEFLADVMDKTGGSEEKLARLFGSVEGLSKIMLLGKGAAADYQDALEAMSSSAGRLDQAFETVTSSRAAQLSMSMNKLKNNAIQFGQSLAPYIDIVSGALGNLSDKLSQMSEEEMKSVLNTALLVTGLLGAVSAISKVASAAKTLKLAFSGPAGWVTLAVVGIAGLVAGIKALSDCMPSVEKSMDNLFNNLDGAEVEKFNKGFEIGIQTTVTADDYTTKVTGAMNEIKTALLGIEGIDATEAAQIQQAIASGSGIDVLKQALEEMNVPEGKAEEIAGTYTSAMATISTTLKGLKLSDEATKHIEALIESGAGSDEITAALVSFGVDEGVAQSAADSITTEMGKVDAAVAELGLDEDARKELSLGALSDRRLIGAALKLMGAPQDVVDSVLAGYDTLAGSLTAKMTGVFGEVAAALTDGLPDDQETVSELEAKIRGYFSEAVEGVNTWAAEEMAKLDVTSATYDQDVENIKTKAGEMNAALEQQQAAALAWLLEMAGKSTTEVEARLGEFHEIMKSVQEVTAEIEAGKAAALSQGASASSITKSGYVTDSETAGMAFGYEKQNYQAKQAQLYNTYQADLAALREKFGGELDGAEYMAQAQALEEEYQAATEAETAAYEQSLQELLAGLGQALAVMQPEAAAKVQEALSALDTLNMAQSVKDKLAGGETIEASDISEDMLHAIVDALGWGDVKSAEQLAGILNEEMANGNTMLAETVSGAIDSMTMGLEESARKALDEADLGFGDEVLATAIEQGVFTGVDGVDLTSSESKLRLLFGGLGTNATEGFTDALDTSAAYSGGESMSASAVDGASTGLDAHSPSRKFETLGKAAGDGLKKGLNSKYWEVYAAAKRLAEAAEKGAKITLRVESPSKVFERIGGFTAEGMIRGVNAKAQKVREAMRSMVSPPAAPTAVDSTGTGNLGAFVPQIIQNNNVSYSGAFTRREARRFGRALFDQMAAESAARGG